MISKSAGSGQSERSVHPFPTQTGNSRTLVALVRVSVTYSARKVGKFSTLPLATF